MNINDLPIEILQNIFKEFTGTELLKCREICSKWRQAVDGFSDEYWRKICEEDFDYFEVPSCKKPYYKEAYRKANLSWRNLYISLSLWPQVENADVKVLNIPQENVKKFQLPADGIIAFPFSCDSSTPGTFDTIVYYDLTTMQEHHRTTLDVPFTDYAENDKLILVKNINNLIDATIKSNNKCYSFKIHEDSKFFWVLLENDFYYLTPGKLYSVKLIQQNEEACLNSTEITANTVNENWRFSEEIINIQDIAYIDSEQVNIRTSTRKIFSVINNEMKLLNFFHNSTSIKILEEYGFELSASDICSYLQMVEYYGECRIPVRSLDFRRPIDAVYIYDKIVIIASSQCFHTLAPRYELLIYYNPYNDKRELAISETYPDITLDLDAFGIGDAQQRPAVTQIDVVEAINGHNIIVLCGAVIYVIDLNHMGRRTKPLFDQQSKQILCNCV